MTLSDSDLSTLVGRDAGRHPAYGAETLVDSATGVPDAASAGVLVDGAQLAQVRVDLAYDPAVASIFVGIETVANTTAYEITADATTYTYTSDADATADEILAGLVDEIAAGDGTHVAEVVGSEVRVWRADGAAIGTPSTSAELSSVVTEATTATALVWGLPKIAGAAAGDRRRRWAVLGGEAVSVSRNYVDLWRCSGFERLFIEIQSPDGRCWTNVGPCAVTSALAVTE